MILVLLVTKMMEESYKLVFLKMNHVSWDLKMMEQVLFVFLKMTLVLKDTRMMEEG